MFQHLLAIATCTLREHRETSLLNSIELLFMEHCCS
jgi:hypothetical protein